MGGEFKMIGYVMVGTRDLPQATAFYDQVMPVLGLVRVEDSDDYAAYAPEYNHSAIEFYITKPFDGALATVGNGSMIAFAVSSRAVVDRFHEVATGIGGKDEGKPGYRPDDAPEYYAYARDRDGNKICVVCANEAG